mgnify:CR=1 FL=1
MEAIDPVQFTQVVVANNTDGNGHSDQQQGENRKPAEPQEEVWQGYDLLFTVFQIQFKWFHTIGSNASDRKDFLGVGADQLKLVSSGYWGSCRLRVD